MGNWPFYLDSFNRRGERIETFGRGQIRESEDVPQYNKKHNSTTDPDASVTRRGKGRSKLEYQVHRAVDGENEIITATEVTPGEVHEAHRLQALIDNHEKNIDATIETVVADSKYGTLSH